MIPAELAAITWSDIEALVANAREEDDTIEFKRSFSGGDDLSALGEGAKREAINGIAQEAIAFLNTRGGDVVIGVREASGAHPRAEEITPVKNPAENADRLARGLAELVEPAQTNIAVRSLLDPADPESGVIIVRTRASLRAPHRSKRTKECYVRRGTESLPMPMDEIQDLTLYRSRIRTEQLELLDRQFADFREGRSDQLSFSSPIFQIMAVMLPFTEQDLEINDNVLGALSSSAPSLFRADGTTERLDVAFRGLTGRWRPMLRGKKREDFYLRNPGQDIQFSAKRVKQAGILAFEYAAVRFEEDDAQARIHIAWPIGFLAQVAADIKRLSQILPTMLPATLRLGVRVDGAMSLISGANHWQTASRLPAGLIILPDFFIATASDLDAFFDYAQVDLLSLCEMDGPAPYSLTPPGIQQDAVPG